MEKPKLVSPSPLKTTNIAKIIANTTVTEFVLASSANSDIVGANIKRKHKLY